MDKDTKGYQIGKCRSCGAEVIFAEFAKKDGSTGAPMPFNKTRVRAYELYQTDHGVPWAEPIRNEEGGSSEILLVYVSHFLTCPDRKQWSKN